MKRPHGLKRGKGKMPANPKYLRGALKQADTMADKPTMGNPKFGKRMAKARNKRLEKAAV